MSGSTTLAATTHAERATLCDCTNALEGGYGKSFPCDGGLSDLGAAFSVRGARTSRPARSESREIDLCRTFGYASRP